MFTLTITPKVGEPRVESFATKEEMQSMYSTYVRCGISVKPSKYVDTLPMGTAKISFGYGRR